MLDARVAHTGRVRRGQSSRSPRDLAARIGIAIDRARLYLEVEERADAARVLTYVADAVLLLDRADVVRLWNLPPGITGIASAVVLGRPPAEVIPGWREAVDSIPISASPAPGHPSDDPDRDRARRAMDRDLGRRVLRRTVCALPRRDGGRQLEGLKADFIATASHELRTPLAAV